MPDLGIDKYCRRDANQLSKIDEDPLCSFFVVNIHLPLSTLKAYYKIIKEFEDYLSSLVRSDFWDFLNFKFQNIDFTKDSPSSSYRSYLKYRSVLKQFLMKIYSLPKEMFIKSSCPKTSKNKNSARFVLADKHVKDAFSELISLNKFEDAMILYLIYTLCISVESVSMITL